MRARPIDYLSAINKWAYKRGYQRVYISDMKKSDWGILKRIIKKIPLEMIPNLYNWLADNNYLKLGLISFYVLKGIKDYIAELEMRKKLYG